MSEQQVKCVRCPKQAAFGEYASTDPNDTLADVLETILPALGWSKTFAGWQCPAHGPSDGGWEAGYQQGAAAERAATVAWLRGDASELQPVSARKFADAITAGEHHKDCTP